jgi:hypothetical protein
MDPESRLDLIAMLARDKTWDALVMIGRELLDNYYPLTVFDGSSGDPGPEYVVAHKDTERDNETALVSSFPSSQANDRRLRG